MNTFASQLTFALPDEDLGAFFEGEPYQTSSPVPSTEITPEKALFVNCATHAEIDALWATLSATGVILMELGQYPFSERFGWVQDEFGISWQVSLAPIQ